MSSKLGDIVAAAARRVIGADGVANVRVHLLDESVLGDIIRLADGAGAGRLEDVGAANCVDHLQEDGVPDPPGRRHRLQPAGMVAQRGGAHEVLQIRASEARRLAGDEIDVEVRVDPP